jgi:hypothetical protein
MCRGGDAATRSLGGGALEAMIVPGVAGGMAMKKDAPTAFRLDRTVDRTTACGQPRGQHCCMQPVRETCGIWQSTLMWLMAMGQ